MIHRPIVVPIRRHPLNTHYKPSCPCGESGPVEADIRDAQAWARQHANPETPQHMTDTSLSESPAVLRDGYWTRGTPQHWEEA